MHTLLAAFGTQAQLIGQTDTESTTMITVGFLFVLTALAVLAAIISVIGAVFARSAAAEARKATKAALEEQAAARERVLTTEATTEDDASEATADAEPNVEDDPALIAVISAAIHSVIGDKPHRVVTIRRAGAGWAEEGRRQIFSSHRLR